MSPEVAALVGAQVRPTDGQRDDRVRFTGPDGTPCPEVGLRMTDLLQPVHSAASQQAWFPPSYISSMREAGVVLAGSFR